MIYDFQVELHGTGSRSLHNSIKNGKRVSLKPEKTCEFFEIFHKYFMKHFQGKKS